MATALKLKSDIKKLKAAINSKATPKSFLPKLKNQLEKAEGELKSLKEAPKGGKPKKSTSAGTEKTLSALEKLVNKKKYSVYKGRGVDLKKDAGEGAFQTGRRVSKGLKSNQYGSAKENKGNVYYEYRPNRLDVKQPKRKQTYPKLEDGGILSKEDFLDEIYDMAGSVQVVERSSDVQLSTDNRSDLNPFIQKYAEFGKAGYGLVSEISEVKMDGETYYYLTIKYPKFANGGMMARGGKSKIELKDASNLSEQERFELKVLKALSGYNKGLNINSLLEALRFSNYRYSIRATDEEVKQVESALSSLISKGYVEESGFGYNQTVEGRRYLDSFQYGTYADGGMMAKGGEVRYKLKGSNFGQQIENGQKFKSLITKVYENQTGENKYPENLIKEIAFTGKIVKSDGSNYLKDYAYKGTLTKFEFLDDKDFIEALKYVDRPAIRKFEEGGYMASGGEVDLLKEDDYVWNAVGKKLVVDKVTDDEYYLRGFMQKGDSPFSKSKVHQYIKTGEWSLSPKMASGGELHRSEEKYAEGGTIYSEDKLKEIIDEEILTPLYNVINGFDMVHNYLRKTNRQQHLTKTLSMLNYLQILEASEKIEEYTSKK